MIRIVSYLWIKAGLVYFLYHAEAGVAGKLEIRWKDNDERYRAQAGSNAAAISLS